MISSPKGVYRAGGGVARSAQVHGDAVLTKHEADAVEPSVAGMGRRWRLRAEEHARRRGDVRPHGWVRCAGAVACKPDDGLLAGCAEARLLAVELGIALEPAARRAIERQVAEARDGDRTGGNRTSARAV